MVDIIIFATVAGILIYKMYTILGSKTGNEPIDNKEWGGRKEGEEEVVIAPREEEEESKKPLDILHKRMEGKGKTVIESSEIYKEIRKELGLLSEREFLEGVKRAFGMILNSFAEGDKETLSSLLSEKVYDKFSKVIDERKEGEMSMELDIELVSRLRVIDSKYGKEEGHVYIVVEIESEQRKVVYDEEHRVVEGHPSKVVPCTDVWTFKKDMNDGGLNWELSSTRAGEGKE